MGELKQGFEGFRMLESKAIRAGRSPRSVRVPVMPVHAAEEGAGAALCGEPLAEVSDQPWIGGRGLYKWCPECREVAPRERRAED